MRRKYDIRNKRTFIIILILSIAIIGIFSLFIYKYKHTDQIQYKVNTGSIVQDNNKNFIDVKDGGLLKVRWNGNYYLIYQDEKINLGKKVIVFDTISGGIKLYGKFYEITESGKIVHRDNETDIRKSTDAKFYKLDDREYLLIDKEITSNDKSIDASNYLLVELDKMGNAKLSNHKLNLKTIKPTTLLTSKYSFDIANELLKYQSLEIDLKKIIGTTNQYKEEEKKDEKEEDSDITTNNTATNQAIANGGGQGSSTEINNTINNGKFISIEELMKNIKTTALIRAYEGMKQIDVDYVVYDPYNEYKSIYAEINKNGEIETIPVSRVDTHMTFEGLKADTDYDINFYYTTIDSETKEVITTGFGELKMHTKKPQYSIKVYRISGINNSLDYKIYLQDDYPISEINVSLSFECPQCNENGYVYIYEDIPITGNGTIIGGTFPLNGYSISAGTLMRLDINNVVGPDGRVDVDSYTTFRFGR